MSAAATAAGYLYASGRLRGRSQREQEQHGEQQGEEKREQKPAGRPRIERPRKEVRVAALPEADAPHSAPEKPRRTPTIQYRTRRWRPSEESQ
jgi:hypothetical protein